MAVLLLEALLFSLWLDNENLPHSGLLLAVYAWGAAGLRGAIAAAAVLAVLGYRRLAPLAPVLVEATGARGVSPAWVAAHVAAIGIFSLLSAALFTPAWPALRTDWIGVLWLAVGLSAIPCAFLAVLPARVLERCRAALGWIPAIALATGWASTYLGVMLRPLWGPTASVTFELARLMLRPLLAHPVARPAELVLGSDRFQVTINHQCSGLEGVGLIVVFLAAWMWFFRDELRFPRTLLLLPAGAALIWMLNALRIAVLILIGHAGAEGIALGGFHSQAGWIAFNGVAIALAVVAMRSPWFRREDAAKPAPMFEANPTVPYLMPLLAILAAGMLSHASSAGFERFYALRLVAGAAAIWWFRREYRRLDWRIGWTAPAIGAAVFLLWIAFDRMLGHTPAPALAGGLAALSPTAKALWIGARVLAASVTVPIAEELAFRGFLIRRLMRPDFLSLAPRDYSVAAVLISSAAFGVLHGGLWVAGCLAGLAYAAAYLRAGRIGEAVAAHATSNVLLAVWVLATGDLHLW